MDIEECDESRSESDEGEEERKIEALIGNNNNMFNNMDFG